MLNIYHWSDLAIIIAFVILVALSLLELFIPPSLFRRRKGK